MEMEQTLLENSKGAPYMSFILDIEVIIRRDGPRVNLTDTEVKGRNEDKKKKEKEREPKERQSRENVSSETPQRTDNDVKVYNMKTDPINIFEQQNINEGEEKNELTTQQKSKEDNCDNLNEKEQDINKENLEATPSIGEKSISIKTNFKKKKITKKDRKLKVFKGKVEPIDFLECNRIFMCNYIKIPTYTNENNSPLIIIPNMMSSVSTGDCKETNMFEQTSKSLHFFYREPPLLSTRRKFKKRSNINFTPVTMKNQLNKNHCLSGDFTTQQNVKRSPEQMDYIFNKNDCSSGDFTRQNNKRNITCLEYNNLLSTNNTILNQNQINLLKQFKTPIYNKSSFFYKYLFLINKTPIAKYNFSNMFCEGTMFEDNAIKKSISLPNLNHCLLLVNKNNIEHYSNSSTDKYIDCNNLNIGKDTALSKIKIQEYKNSTNIKELGNDIGLLKIRPFNSHDNKLLSQLTKITAQHLEKDVSSTVIMDIWKQPTTYKERSMQNVDIYSVPLDSPNKAKTSSETNITYQNTQSLNTQRKTIWKFVQRLLFMCICKPNSELSKDEPLK